MAFLKILGTYQWWLVGQLLVGHLSLHTYTRFWSPLPIPGYGQQQLVCSQTSLERFELSLMFSLHLGPGLGH